MVCCRIRRWLCTAARARAGDIKGNEGFPKRCHSPHFEAVQILGCPSPFIVSRSSESRSEIFSAAAVSRFWFACAVAVQYPARPRALAWYACFPLALPPCIAVAAYGSSLRARSVRLLGCSLLGGTNSSEYAYARAAAASERAYQSRRCAALCSDPCGSACVSACLCCAWLRA